jgi:hypothetical protein
MNSLDKRLSYLGIADFDYLSARLLMLNGLGFCALPKAAEAIEKLIKLFLLLEAKIERNEELGEEQLKKYGHNLVKLFQKLKEIIRGKSEVEFGPDWDEYLQLLQDSYTQRYPEKWTELRIEIDVHKLDQVYTYLRNGIIGNFPIEERDRSRHFGTFISDVYNRRVREHIHNLGGLPPGELLRHLNQSFETLNIDAARFEQE